MSETRVGETKPSETKPRKVVARSVAIALGMICIIIIAGLGGAMAYYVTTIDDKDTKYSNYASSHSYTNDQYNSLDSTYQDYARNHAHTNDDYNSVQSNYQSAQNNLTNYISDHHYTDELYDSLNSTLHSLQALNVTNWPWSQPEPTESWCGDWSLRVSSVYGQTYSSFLPIGVTPFINVADYETMTVIMSFSDVRWQRGCCYITAIAAWATSPSYPTLFSATLTSTLYQIQSINGGYPSAISTDCYPIKAPYVQVTPSIQFGNVFPAGEGNATISVYVYLSNVATTSSIHKTMSWWDDELSNASSYYFGVFDLSGFSQLTISLSSNVTWNVVVTTWTGLTTSEAIDAFSFSGPIYRTYALNSQMYYVYVHSPSSTPWELIGSFYATT
jgi:hypothetical protein